MFTSDTPVYPNDFDYNTGYKPDFKGLGVFLTKTERENTWKIVAI